MTTTIVFDVNETLLDLAAMDPIFERHFGDASVRREWFSQVLMTTLTMTLVGDYANFAKVGEAALLMVGERRGISTISGPRSCAKCVDCHRIQMWRQDYAPFETMASASLL
ncbi:MAG: hypothetical protein ACTSWI_00460 [Alphaproteobacteria bacterium]